MDAAEIMQDKGSVPTHASTETQRPMSHVRPRKQTSMSLTHPRAVPLPPESRIAAVYAQVNLADAYAIDLPPGTTRSPEALARFVFAHQPLWISILMRIRDALVAGLGLKTARSLSSVGAAGSRIGIFKVYEANSVEVLMGEDDKHLDFRASALYQPAVRPGADSARLVLSTVVHCHNTLGRGYFGLIAPFHRLVVKSYLRHAAKIGWPGEDGVSPSAFRSAGF